MLNEQKSHRSHHAFGAQGISPLSSQGFSANPTDRPLQLRHSSFSLRGNNPKRQPSSMLRRKLKRDSITIEEEEEYGSEYDEYIEPTEDEDGDNQLWCTCQSKSYGNMIACDNQNCPYTWFHYECVGLTQSPEDGKKWYCPTCRNRLFPNAVQTFSSSQI
jgi:hypothetical protein